MSAFQENLSLFFEADDRALVGPECEEIEIPAIFSQTPQTLEDGGTLRVTSSQPSLLVQSTDVADLSVQEGTRVVAADVVYFVHDLQPDGAGMTQLFLSKARRK
jgi:hypothetical protein